MITKSDQNVGLTGMMIHGIMAIPEGMLITMLSMNLLDTYYLAPVLQNGGSNLSDRALFAIQESKLRSLELWDQGFNTHDSFARFLYSLQSTTLECLALSSQIPLLAMAVAIQQCPALTHFSMKHVWVGREDWKCLLNAFCNHKVLSSLTLTYVHWSDNVTFEEAALGFTAMLKENTNIEKLTVDSFLMNQRDGTKLETKILLQVEHNYYSKQFWSLHQTEAASMRAGLVATALGNGLQRKPFFQYALLKANVDLICKHC